MKEESACRDDCGSGGYWKWGILVKVAAAGALLVAARIAVQYAGYDLVPLNTIISALIGAVTFTVSIILSGTLGDYREAERIPGDLASACRALYAEARIMRTVDTDLSREMRGHVAALLSTICANLRASCWRIDEIRAAIGAVDEDVLGLAEREAPPPYVVKLRAELGNVDRLVNRIETIRETTFLPAAYAIADFAVASLLLLLLFVRLEPVWVAPVVYLVTASLLVGMIILIREMDNPYECDQLTHADIDLRPLYEVERLLFEDRDVKD